MHSYGIVVNTNKLISGYYTGTVYDFDSKNLYSFVTRERWKRTDIVYYLLLPFLFTTASYTAPSGKVAVDLE